MKLRALLVVLLCAAPVAAQLPPCFRSKYSAEWPIKVRHVDLRDRHQLSARERKTIVRELKRQCDCWPCALSYEVSEQIRDMYQWFGFFQAVADVDIRKLGVDSYAIVARVEEGPQYRLKQVEFAHVRAFPAEQLRALFPIAPGEPFDTRKVRAGLEALRRLYSSNGYLDSAPVPVPQIEGASKTILLRIDVDEGRAYRFGPLLLAGAEPAAGVGKRVLADWNALAGQPYNPTRLERFIDEHALLLKARTADFYSTNVDVTPDNAQGVVSVRIRFPMEVSR